MVANTGAVPKPRPGVLLQETRAASFAADAALNVSCFRVRSTQPSDRFAVLRLERLTRPALWLRLDSWAEYAEQAHYLTSCGGLAVLLAGFWV